VVSWARKRAVHQVSNQEKKVARGHAGRRRGAGPGLLGAGGLAYGYAAELLHFPGDEIVAALLIITPLISGAILVSVLVFGSTASSDRIFRLLRWIRDREEPPGPADR
jgi:hypothetical protein